MNVHENFWPNDNSKIVNLSDNLVFLKNQHVTLDHGGKKNFGTMNAIVVAKGATKIKMDIMIRAAKRVPLVNICHQIVDVVVDIVTPVNVQNVDR